MGNRLLWLFLTVLIALPVSGETWYVRKDGGTRNSAGKKGQCDGKADAPYSGKGQHCAFKEVAYLAYDGTYSAGGSWVIAGGDTVHIAAGQYRVGYRGPNAQDHDGLATAGNPYAPGLPACPFRHGRSSHADHWEHGAKSTQIFAGYRRLRRP